MTNRDKHCHACGHVESWHDEDGCHHHDSSGLQCNCPVAKIGAFQQCRLEGCG